MLQKFDLLRSLINRRIKLLNCVIELSHGVEALAEAIVDGRIVTVLVSLAEVLDGLVGQARLQLRRAHVKVADGVFRIYLNRALKVLDCILMITHVLIHETTLNICR